MYYRTHSLDYSPTRELAGKLTGRARDIAQEICELRVQVGDGGAITHARLVGKDFTQLRVAAEIGATYMTTAIHVSPDQSCARMSRVDGMNVFECVEFSEDIVKFRSWQDSVVLSSSKAARTKEGANTTPEAQGEHSLSRDTDESVEGIHDANAECEVGENALTSYFYLFYLVVLETVQRVCVCVAFLCMWGG